MEEEAADGETQEVFDKGAGVFAETFDNSVVLDACDDGKVERDEGENGLENGIAKPQGAESRQNENNGEGDEENVIFSHGKMGWAISD